MKRFFVEFDFVPVDREALPEGEPKLYGGTWDYTKQEHSPVHRFYGNASSLKTAKRYVREIKAKYPTQAPYNIRIFDYEAPNEPCGHVGCVYLEP